MEKNNENAIEFINGDKTCTVSFSSQKYCNKMKRLYKKNPECFEKFVINPDGTVYARIPLSWLKVSTPRTVNMTDEERQKIAERLKGGKG